MLRYLAYTFTTPLQDQSKKGVYGLQVILSKPELAHTFRRHLYTYG